MYLAMIESGFNVNAYSRAHACGPWQFIKGTAGRYGLKVNHWLDERRNPEKATKAAASYLRDLYEEFGCWYLAAAGYNAGENKVRRGITTYETADFWDMCDYDLFAKETKNYVPQMIAATIIAKNPEKYGFTDVEYQQPVACVKVSVPPQTYLEAVALACGVDCQTIRELNAEFKRGCTPPSGYSKVNIPASTAQLFRDNFDRVKTTVKTCYRGYVVQRGDTAAKIARKFGISRKTLLSANKIKGARSIKKGNVLQIPYQVKVYALSPRKLKSITKIAACTLDGDEKRTGLAKRHGGNKKANVGRTKMKYHRVRKGDTIWNIAQKYNVTPADIRSWNNIDTNVILPGARLKVRISSAI